MIRTPSDLTSYLIALAKQHPQVEQVVWNDRLRAEEATLATALYPQVDIETPIAMIPRSDSPMMLSTRVWILTNTGNEGHVEEDMGLHLTYTIGSNLIAAITRHADDNVINIALSGDGIELKPVVAIGSDQRRGWMFELDVEVDQSLCFGMPFDPDDFFMPQFSWTIEQSETHNLTFTDTSTLRAGVVATWYWKEEIAQPVADTFNPADGISLGIIPDGPEVRFIHVWLKLVADGVELWAYARITTEDSAGISTPYIPIYPT